MKLKLQHISLTVLLAFLAPAVFFTAHAQDAPSLVTDVYDTRSDGDRVIYLPGGEAEPSGGGTSKPLPVLAKDSASAMPQQTQQTAHRAVRTPSETVKPSQVNKQNKEEDESILSFNFLYYIIQKYKLQDIVD